MASPTGLDRRSLLKLGGGLAASTFLSLPLVTIARSAVENHTSNQFVALTPALSETLEAVAARILPTTQTPGAREAGAIWFIDAAVAGILSDSADADQSAVLPLLENGARDLDDRAGSSGRDASFTTLATEEQDALLVQIENSDFFGLMHFLTLAGTFTLPAYRGNRGEVGWDMLGFERRHSWEAPFGHYDAGVHES
jgi:gluconate 2-dehydrogenase gamma chain